MSLSESDTARLIEAKRCYQMGKHEEALKLYLPLAESGNVGCQLFVGLLYSTGGRGVPRNFDAARKWLNLAAEAGNADARYALGVEDWNLGDYSAAADNFQYAATLGHSAAYYQLARMYRYGVGFEKNLGKAFELYEEAARRGHIFARRDIAIMLIKGYKGWRMVPLGFIKWLASIAVGIRTAVKDPYSEQTF